jgi:transcriptional regulator with PAS, ATPase and Fis domain
VDVRIISATNRDLREHVEKGLFRQDLFFRINVIPIILPPLRERTQDIPILAESFFSRLRLKSGKNIESISREALDALMGFRWPGNVRELKSAFEYAFVTCQESILKPQHFPPNIFEGMGPAKQGSYRVLSKEKTKKRRLLEALELTGGNQTKAAQILGVSRVTVWNRMKKYGIDLKKVAGPLG